MLTTQHWKKLKSILRDFNIYIKSDLRLFIEAILYRIRVGCPWRDLPKSFGNSNSIFRKYTRWCKQDKLLKIFKLLSQCADKEWLFIDGSHVRAHQHATGTKDQVITRSIGGNSSKIHLAVDSDGNPIEFIITDSLVHDVKVAHHLIDQLDTDEAKVICVDKGYDSDQLRDHIINKGIQSNIPKKSNTRSADHPMDWYLYKIRHLVENAFARLKHFRGIATRYDKLKRNYGWCLNTTC